MVFEANQIKGVYINWIIFKLYSEFINLKTNSTVFVE